MNILAHLYLSFDSLPKMVGNFIGDHVRSKDLPRFDVGIREGILLHWEIDAFTDAHPIVMQSKKRLRPKYHKYSPVIVDIFYDHFLSKNWQQYHELPLNEFSSNFFNYCDEIWELLPTSAQHMLPYMKKYEWLAAYGEFQGLENVMKGMTKRAAFQSKMDESISDFKAHYNSFEAEFESFFPDLISFSKDHNTNASQNKQ